LWTETFHFPFSLHYPIAHPAHRYFGPLSLGLSRSICAQISFVLPPIYSHILLDAARRDDARLYGTKVAVISTNTCKSICASRRALHLFNYLGLLAATA
jgi:hypothetical protein